MLEMKQGLENISLSVMHPFIDDNVDDEGESVFGQDSNARFINGSSIKNRRLNSERSETELYSKYDRLLESRAKSQDLYFDNERMLPNSLTVSKGENAYSNCKIFGSSDSSVSPRFTRERFDFRKSGWHYGTEGKKGTATEAGGLLTISEPDLDQFLLDRKMYGVDTNDALYKGCLVSERGNIRNDKLLNALGLNHKDNYVKLGSLSEKFGTPLGGERGRIDEPRFSSVDNQIKTSYSDFLNLSTTLNLPSRNLEGQEVDDCMFNSLTSAINELDIENATRSSISPKYNPLSQLNCSSAKGFNTLLLNVQFPDCNRNHRTYDSVIDDDIVGARIPDPPGLHPQRSSPPVGGQSVKDMNHCLSYSNCRAMSRGKTCEADGFIRSYVSDVKNQVPDHIYSDYLVRDVQFSPVDFGSSPLNVRYGSRFLPYRVSPKYLSCQMPEEIFTSCEIQSPRANLTDLNLRNLEYDAVNGERVFYNNVYDPQIDNKGYNSSECGACTGSGGKQRKSVFTRLTSSSTTPAKHDRVNDTGTVIDSSVDELMEILRRGEKLVLKNTKRKKLENQHLGEGEKKKKKKSTMMMTSPDNFFGKNELVFVPKKLTEESNKTVDGIVHETLMETRAVEFRRRREKLTSMFEKKTNECCSMDIKKEKAEPKIQPEEDKQPKRRKLVRPVFAVNDVNSETNDCLRSCVNSVSHD